MTLVVRSQGYRTATKTLSAAAGEKRTVDFILLDDALGLDEVVISATRNRVERKSAPVVVSTIKPRLLTATQSLSLADGLSFAPGVRVEAAHALGEGSFREALRPLLELKSSDPASEVRQAAAGALRKLQPR